MTKGNWGVAKTYKFLLGLSVYNSFDFFVIILFYILAAENYNFIVFCAICILQLLKKYKRSKSSSSKILPYVNATDF